MHIADTLLFTEEDIKKVHTIEENQARSKILDKHRQLREGTNKKQYK